MNHQVTVEDMERNIVSLQITSQLGLKSEYGSSTRCSRHTHSHAVCDVVAEDRSRGTYESANNKRLREVYKVPGGRSIIFSVNIRQRVREPSEKVKLTTAQKPPQGASGAPRRGRSARWRYPTNNQPASRNP